MKRCHRTTFVWDCEDRPRSVEHLYSVLDAYGQVTLQAQHQGLKTRTLYLFRQKITKIIRLHQITSARQTFSRMQIERHKSPHSIIAKKTPVRHLHQLVLMRYNRSDQKRKCRLVANGSGLLNRDPHGSRGFESHHFRSQKNPLLGIFL